MAVGPELVAVRDVSVADKVDVISLGAFSPYTFPKLPANDPTLRFLLPRHARELAGSGKDEFLQQLIDDRAEVIWGIHRQDSLEGYATLGLGDEGSDVCYFGIVLQPNARKLGIGSLAASAMVSFALEYGALRRVSKRFSDYMTIGTVIHPENHASQVMCTRAGFVRVEGDKVPVNGVNFYSYLCTREPKVPLAKTRRLAME